MSDKEYFECSCECHTNEEIVHEGRCCFECPKCHKQVAIHYYNEHKHNCTKKKRLAAKRRRKAVNAIDAPKEMTGAEIAMERLLNRGPRKGSASLRYRKRPPVGK